MRLLFVVQRFGAEVPGGAEGYCRDVAIRLARRGHDVTVVTSRALNYVDWGDHYPAGQTVDDGVQVVRLPLGRHRDDSLFAPLLDRVVRRPGPVPLHLQEEWMHLQGPHLPGLPSWLTRHAGSHDAAVFFTYLYYPTWAGLPVARNLTTTVLHPMAHDEPTFHLSLVDTVVAQAHALALLSDEEEALVRRRFPGVTVPSRVSGAGVDLDAVARGDGDRFRQAYGLGEAPYLLYVGRVDPHKGAVELFDYFRAYKERNPGPLKLVVVGDPVRPLPDHVDVVGTGFVDDSVKHDAIAGCTAFVHPSWFESFAIVLCEAWAHQKPALVQGRSEVLRGMAWRSGGALPYAGFPEFEAAVDLVLSEPGVAPLLGGAGREFVERHYTWDRVLDTYERFLLSITAHRRPPAVSRSLAVDAGPTP